MMVIFIGVYGGWGGVGGGEGVLREVLREVKRNDTFLPGRIGGV